MDCNKRVEYKYSVLGGVLCTISDASISEIRYDAYGNTEPDYAPVYDYGYAGMRYEADADIYLTPNRAYSPTLGRWLTPAPLGTMPKYNPL